MAKRFETYKATARQLEINHILNEISLGRRSNLDDLAPELAAAVRSEVNILRSIYERANSVTSATAAAPTALVSSQVEPLMVAPPMVANAPLFVPPPPLEPELLLVPPQGPLVAPPRETEMALPFAMAPPRVANAPLFVPPLPELLLVPPQEPVMVPSSLAMAPPMLADVPVAHTLLAALEHPLVPAAGVGEDDGFPRDGSYLLEMADAILDDGSGRAVQATDEDVDRLLWEHGLESFIKPKPM